MSTLPTEQQERYLLELLQIGLKQARLAATELINGRERNARRLATHAEHTFSSARKHLDLVDVLQCKTPDVLLYFNALEKQICRVVHFLPTDYDYRFTFPDRPTPSNPYQVWMQ